MKVYGMIFAVLMCFLSITICYSWGEAEKRDMSDMSDGDDDDQLDVFQAAAKRNLFQFQKLKCATSQCRPRSRSHSLRCCPGLRCKCGILWNAGQCRCSTNYGYGR